MAAFEPWRARNSVGHESMNYGSRFTRVMMDAMTDFEFHATELSAAKGATATAWLTGHLREGAVLVGSRGLVHIDGSSLTVSVCEISNMKTSVPSALGPVSLKLRVDQGEELFAKWDWSDPNMWARVTGQGKASSQSQVLLTRCSNCGCRDFHRADNTSHRRQPIIHWYCCDGCGRVESFAGKSDWFETLGEAVLIGD